MRSSRDFCTWCSFWRIFFNEQEIDKILDIFTPLIANFVTSNPFHRFYLKHLPRPIESLKMKWSIITSKIELDSRIARIPLNFIFAFFWIDMMCTWILLFPKNLHPYLLVISFFILFPISILAITLCDISHTQVWYSFKIARWQLFFDRFAVVIFLIIDILKSVWISNYLDILNEE